MTDDSLLAQLAEEFTAEMRDGKPGDIEKYARRYPKLAERIRELFPTLMLLEGIAAKGVRSPAEPINQPGLSPNSTFGQYRIIREIGRGGMGIVYEAMHLQLEKRVALKILPLRTSMDAGQLERFFREARTAAGLHHTNIVPVFDVGQVAGTPYYAMQYIEGRSLAAILQIMQLATKDNPSDVSPPESEQETASKVQVSSERKIEPDDKQKRPVRSIMDSSARVRAGLPARLQEYFGWVAHMGIQAAEGLAHAHERKVMHRDIKPSNLLLDNQGVLWITDFGLARKIEDPAVTQSGVLLGTPRYMSPEQAEATKRLVDHRSDIYSLGATLYELLTCRPVFEGKTPHDVISQILTREPVAPRRLNAEIPADLSTIVMKALAKGPEDRYQSASQLADDLSRWLRMEPIKARRIGPLGRTIRWCRRNPRLAAVTAIATAIILALSSIYYVGLMKEKANTRRALQREPLKPLMDLYIRGKIRDSAGRLMPGADVCAFSYFLDPTGERHCAKADQNGRFSIRVYMKGRYGVRPRDAIRSDPSLFLPSDQYPVIMAKDVTLTTGGMEANVDLKMPQRNGMLLVTAVDAPSHLPIEMVLVQVCPAEKMLQCPGSALFRSDTGEYRVYVPPYPFNLSIRAPDHQEWIQFGDNETVLGPGSSRNLHIEMKPLSEPFEGALKNNGEPLAPLLPSPVQLAPAEGAKFTGSPARTLTLKWSKVEGASSYSVEVDSCQNSESLNECFQPTPLVFSFGSQSEDPMPSRTKDTTFTFDFRGAHLGRWRVWAVDEYGRKGIKSPWRLFIYAR